MLLWCRACEVGYASAGEWPPICPFCEEPEDWSREALDPVPPFRLSRPDAVFLHVLKIWPDPADCAFPA